jgi:hypothetical protein
VSNPTRKTIPWIGSIIGLAVFAGWLTWATTVRSLIIIVLHYTAFWVVPLLIVTVVALVGMYGLGARSDRKQGKAPTGKPSFAERFPKTIFTGAALLLLGALFFFISHSYLTNREYLSEVKIEKTAITEQDERVPYQTGAETLPKNLGSVRGDVSDVTYVDGRYTAVITNKGVFQGLKEVISWSSPVTGGDGTYERASFTAGADRKLSGYWSHSLLRQIRDERVGVLADEEDAYGYIAGGKAFYVVPLRTVEGWIAPRQVAAGVAIVDENGNITIKETVAEGEVPGPVYPASLAQRIREANEGLGSLTDQWFSRAGYEQSDRASGVDDNGDSEKDNPTEFVLYHGGAGRYVTPLTPRGASKSIVAVAEMSATTVTAGKDNVLVIHELAAPRKANGEIEKEIKTQFARLEWASGLKMFEMVPAGNKEWLVTLGQSIEVMYRVRILENGTMIVEKPNSTFVQGVTASGAPTDADGKEIEKGNTFDFSGATDEQLLAEINRRLTAARGQG